MNEHIISVIVPAFNIEKYIVDSLDSISKQTYRNIECVVVDDGSTDSTGVLCDEFAAKDNRFLIIHQENTGQAGARNNAYKHIHGEYIMYVDGDDILHPELIRILVEIQRKSLAEVVHCDYASFRRNIKGTRTYANSKGSYYYELYTNVTALKEFLYARKFTGGPWAKLIKAELMSDLEFPLNRGYEDMAVMYKVYAKANGLAHTPTKLYYYRQHRLSTMHHSFDDRKLDRIRNAEEIRQFIMNKFPMLRRPLATRYCMAQMQTLMWLPFCDEYKTERIQAFNNLCEMRGVALKDRCTSLSFKIMLMSSYLGPAALMALGRIYRLSTGQ